MSDCIFCKIAAKEIKSAVIYEDEAAIAFMDVNPASPGHTLVIPKKHAATIDEMSADELGNLFRAVSKVAAAVKKALNPEGINILQNNGSAAGQVVPHVHVHIIPRHSGDGLMTPWTPHPAGAELPDIAERIKNAL